MAKYIRKVPQTVEATRVTEEDYSGFETICAHCLDSLIHVDERLLEEKYKESTFLCDYEDGGFCVRDCGTCEHERSIGYIRVKNRLFYPLVGDYMIKDEYGQIRFMTEKEFESIFEIAPFEPISD